MIPGIGRRKMKSNHAVPEAGVRLRGTMKSDTTLIAMSMTSSAVGMIHVIRGNPRGGIELCMRAGHVENSSRHGPHAVLGVEG